MAPSRRLTQGFLLWIAIMSLAFPVSLRVAEAFSPAGSCALFDGDFVASSIDDDTDSAADSDTDSDTDSDSGFDSDSDGESDTERAPVL